MALGGKDPWTGNPRRYSPESSGLRGSGLGSDIMAVIAGLCLWVCLCSWGLAFLGG